MAKKKEETVEEVKIEVVAEPSVKKVLPLSVEFGRDDLNQLRDKLNEVIENL